MVRRRFVLLVPTLAAGGDWPQFLGPSRDGTYAPAATLSANSLTKARLVWKKDIGAGFSSPVVSNGRLYLFHRRADTEILDCWDAVTAAPVWKLEYATTYRDDFGLDEGPRGAPTVVGGRVFTFGAEGVLHATDAATGEKLWRVDTHAKFGVRKGFFGAAASPLVDTNTVYVNVGGPNDAGIVAFEALNGTVKWTATNDDAGYSSPIAATLNGSRTVLCFTRAGLVALDAAAGKVRWQHPWRSRTNASVNAAVPVVAGDLIFLSASYGTGAVVLRVAGDKVSQLWASDDVLSNHYASSVHKDGAIFGFHGRQEFGQSLRCIEMKTGKVLWSADDFGAGTVTPAGNQLLIIRENGEAIMAAATTKSYQPTSKAQLLPGVIRSYPAIAEGRIFVRSDRQLAAYEVPGL